MKLKSWIAAGLLFLASSSLWAGYLISRRAFLRDFNGGVHAYLAGSYLDAEQNLQKALARRPGSAQAKQLLFKVLIEESFTQYHKKDFAGALETLSRASKAAASDSRTQETLSALRDQLSALPDKRPVPIEQVLSGLYHRLPDQDQPSSLSSLMEQWLEKSQMNQETILKRFSNNQQRWLEDLEREKESFKTLLYGGLLLFGAGGLLLAILFLGMLHAYFGRRGVFSRLLEAHYQRLIAVLPAGTQVLLGPPMSLLYSPEAAQLDAIEAEITSGKDAQASHRKLESLLEGGDLWVRARAAKLLYPLNPRLALAELKTLTCDASKEAQISSIWALAELATPESIDLLAPLAYSPAREIQQGAVRSLLQIQSRDHLPADVRTRLSERLTEVRSRTGLIF